MISEALDYPRRGDDWIKRIGIGGILYFLGFLVIPLLLVEGYLYRVLGATIRGEEHPPAWEEWVELLVEGLKMYIIQIVYVLVPTIVILIGLALSAGGGGLRIVGILMGILGAVLLLLAVYLLPAALANFAHTESIGNAFDFGTIRRAAFTTDYLIAIVLALVLGLILNIIGGFLTWIIIGIFVLFYAQIVVYFIWARGFANALDLGGPA